MEWAALTSLQYIFFYHLETMDVQGHELLLLCVDHQ